MSVGDSDFVSAVLIAIIGWASRRLANRLGRSVTTNTPPTYMQKMRAAGIVTVDEPPGSAPIHLAPTRPRRER